MSAVEDLDNEGSKSITQAKDPDSPLFISDHYLMSPVPAEYKPLHQEIVAKDGFAIVIPPVRQRWEYREYYEAPFISKVLEEYDHPDVVRFLVKFSDGNESRVSSSPKFSATEILSEAQMLTLLFFLAYI